MQSPVNITTSNLMTEGRSLMKQLKVLHGGDNPEGLCNDALEMR